MTERMENRIDRHQGDGIKAERAQVLGSIREAVKRRQTLTRTGNDRERMKADADIAKLRRRLLGIEASRQRMTRPCTYITR